MAEKLNRGPYSRKYIAPDVDRGPVIIQHYDFTIDEKNQLIIVATEKEDIQKAISSHENDVGLINVIKLATAKGIDPMSAPFANKPSDNQPILPDVETWDDVDKARKEALKTLADISKKLGITPNELTKAVDAGKVSDLAKAKLTKKAESEVKENG